MTPPMSTEGSLTRLPTLPGIAVAGIVPAGTAGLLAPNLGRQFAVYDFTGTPRTAAVGQFRSLNRHPRAGAYARLEARAVDDPAVFAIAGRLTVDAGFSV